METILKILGEMNETVDFSSAEGLIDNKIIESLDLMELVSELEDQFGIEITMEELTPENFNSAAAIWSLVQRLAG